MESCGKPTCRSYWQVSLPDVIPLLPSVTTIEHVFDRSPSLTGIHFAEPPS
jgi:hypothetical protein